MKTPSKTLLVVACSVVIGLLGLLFIRNLIDFPVYYAAGQSLLSGRADLYSPDFALGRVMDYRYPPFFLIALTPVWLLPYKLAAYIWYLLSILEIIGCVLIVLRVFPSFRESRVLQVLVALSVGQYFVMVLHYGNAHLLMTFLLFAAFYFVLQRKELPGAVLLALATTIKLTPILFLPYFVLKQRWSLLAQMFLLLALFNIAPSIYFGFRGNNELLRSWYGHVVANQEFHEDNGPINLALKGQLRRSLSRVEYSQRVDGDTEYPSVQFASFSREQVVRAWLVLAAGVFAGVLILIGWRQRRRSLEEPASLAQELALIICLTLLAAPLTSKIYFIELLWPAACLASFAVDRTTGSGRVAMRVMIVVAFVNFVLPLLPGRSVQRLLLVLGVDFYLNCLVMVGLIYALLSRRRRSQTQSAEPQMPDPSGARTS